MPNKTVVITGASAGIGAALALRLARDSHNLVLAARRKDVLDEVGAQAQSAGSPRAVTVVADMTSRADVERLSDEAIKAFGSYDVWVNNAGRGITRQVLDLSDDDIDQMMSVNVKSALYGMQTAAKHFMQRGRGQIVNISSFLGRVPMATQRSAYNAAKHALNALTANLRVDLRDRYPDIKVTLVMPGMVSTEFGRNSIGSPEDTPIPSGPNVQTVEDVVDVIARVIETPVAEVYTNPASPALARKYFEDVGAYEAQSGGWGPR
ncbi:MAG TPA: SDR family oxidoreductase [Gemmatimonadaceae bacterium]|jgi:short-subunit dehydrogenase